MVCFQNDCGPQSCPLCSRGDGEHGAMTTQVRNPSHFTRPAASGQAPNPGRHQGLLAEPRMGLLLPPSQGQHTRMSQACACAHRAPASETGKVPPCLGGHLMSTLFARDTRSFIYRRLGARRYRPAAQTPVMGHRTAQTKSKQGQGGMPSFPIASQLAVGVAKHCTCVHQAGISWAFGRSACPAQCAAPIFHPAGRRPALKRARRGCARARWR